MAESAEPSPEVIYCVNHPDRVAIERCEVCGDPLCGYCLYYTADGQRLCREHAHQAEAQGIFVIPPAVYAAGIIPAQARASDVVAGPSDLDFRPKGPKSSEPTVLYRGNNNDLTAFVSLLTGLFALVTVCSFGLCSPAIPIIGFLLSIMALLNAKQAVDPKRTRQQAFIGLGITGVIGLFVLLCIGLYFAALWGAFRSAGSSQPRFFPTFPTVAPLPSRTFAPIATSTPSLTPTGRGDSTAAPAVRLADDRATPRAGGLSTADVNVSAVDLPRPQSAWP
jgi:hypothetical protein